MIHRRGLITGLISLVAAPAIVRVENLMPIYVPKLDTYTTHIDYGYYEVYTQVVMKDGEIITDLERANELRKYIRSISRLT